MNKTFGVPVFLKSFTCLCASILLLATLPVNQWNSVIHCSTVIHRAPYRQYRILHFTSLIQKDLGQRTQGSHLVFDQRQHSNCGGVREMWIKCSQQTLQFQQENLRSRKACKAVGGHNSSAFYINNVREEHKEQGKLLHG